jgi:hypothetical protein
LSDPAEKAAGIAYPSSAFARWPEAEAKALIIKDDPQVQEVLTSYIHW